MPDSTTTAPKSKPVLVEVKTRWLHPQNGLMLLENQGELRLLDVGRWSGEVDFALTQEEWQTLPKPEVTALLQQAELTPEALTVLFAQAGIVSPQTVTRDKVQYVIQMMIAKIDLLK